MRFEVETGSETDFVDVTDRVAEAVRKSGAENGICLVSVRHTTAAVVIQENVSGVTQDLKTMLNDLVPKGAGYVHDRGDGNAHSHLRASLLGNSVSFPVRGGKPVLGTWQSVLLVELDGPRTRGLDVEVVS